MQQVIVPAECGIYQIRHVESGKRYIGSSYQIPERWKQHLTMLHNKKHHSKYLQRAWVKYTESAFVFEIIELVDDPARLIEREQYYFDIRWDASQTTEYNMTRDAKACQGAMELSVIMFRERRDAFDAFILDTIAQNEWGDLLGNLGSVQAGKMLATYLQVSRSRMEKTIRRLWRQGKVVLAVHGTPHFPNGQPFTPRKRTAALLNIRKAQSVNPGRHNEATKLKIGHAARKTQARIREEGATPNQRTYWTRMEGQTAEDIGGAVLERYLAKKARLIDALKSQAWFPDVPHGCWAAAERIAPLTQLGVKNAYEIFKRMEKNGELAFHAHPSSPNQESGRRRNQRRHSIPPRHHSSHHPHSRKVYCSRRMHHERN